MASLYQEISHELHEALAGEVEDVTLTKISYGARASSTAPRSETETDHPVKGWVSLYNEREIDGSLVKRTDRRVVILAGSLPASVVPVKDDKVTAADGGEYDVVSVERDTASALYICQGRA